jgi:predicted  nucleic acid-binding Zn-ribbon protein
VDIAFAKLIRLQYVDTEIARLLTLIEALPARLQSIDQQIQTANATLAQAKDKLVANQKTRRDLEGEVKGIRESIAKYKRQLNDVKSNKEYDAINKEISETQARIDGLEETILNAMIAADDVEKEIKAAQALQAEAETRLKREKEALAVEKSGVEEQKSTLEAERAAVVAEVPPDQLKLYDRIHKKMSGTALSRVTDDFCSICMMRVRPQLLDEMMAMKKIITCEACGRILYWDGPQGEDVSAAADDPNRKDDSSPDD